MKTIPAGLLAEYKSQGTRIARCLLVTRADSTVFGFTSTDRTLTVLGQDYVPGLDVTSIAFSSGLAVNNLDIKVLYNSIFVREDFLKGLWNNARWEIFEVSWFDPTLGTNTLGHYVTGNVTPGEVSCTVELRALSQFLQQPIGFVTSKQCRARFADYPTVIFGAICGLSTYSYLEDGTVTGVTSQQVMQDTGRSEPADWYGDGLLTFTSGENEDISRKVKSYDSNGTFTFSLPFPSTIGIGDTYTAIAGCRKRLEEDCRDKFDNVPNFQGEPHLPGVDLATAQPTVDGI